MHIGSEPGALPSNGCQRQGRSACTMPLCRAGVAAGGWRLAAGWRGGRPSRHAEQVALAIVGPLWMGAAASVSVQSYVHAHKGAVSTRLRQNCHAQQSLPACHAMKALSPCRPSPFPSTPPAPHSPLRLLGSLSLVHHQNPNANEEHKTGQAPDNGHSNPPRGHPRIIVVIVPVFAVVAAAAVGPVPRRRRRLAPRRRRR